MTQEAKFKGFRVVHANLNNLKSIRTRGYSSFVWPDEGEFKGDTFVFNEVHKEFEPLGIDLVSANMLLTVYGALQRDKSKNKYKRMISKNRATFVQLIQFGWDKTKRKLS